ncbi:MAG TPA: hypothetical protein VFB38_15255 [Chthonomonadaceae bacterium]|nr:hypothetical protein [Chthonomonadaceae bacterium]
MKSGKHSNVIVWVGVTAAAAGIVAVAAIMKWREQSLKNLSTTTRGVQEVLADCYSKIREIEEHLPDLVAPKSVRPSGVRTLANGEPVLGS